jgi:uroporphyrinogen-III synthase
MGGAPGLSLADRKVLVARSSAAATSWIQALSDRGALVTARETFSLESMLSEAAAQRSLERIHGWDWILLTSQNGLRFFVEGLKEHALEPGGLSAKFGVVGPQTARALEGHGRRPDAVADPPSGQGLAVTLGGRIDAGDRILIVGPEKARPDLVAGLAGSGAEIHSVPFYRNRAAVEVSTVARDLVAGAFDAAVFGSPSSFLHLLDAVGEDALESFSRLAVVTIGQTTAQAIRNAGCSVAAVASRPTPEGIANAVEEALSV